MTLKDGASATDGELRDYVKEQIAVFKYPRIIRFGPDPEGSDREDPQAGDQDRAVSASRLCQPGVRGAGVDPWVAVIRNDPLMTPEP